MKTSMTRMLIAAAMVLAPVGFIVASLVNDPAPAQAGGAGTNWQLIRVLKQSDAELVDAGGTSKTITLDGIHLGGAPLEIDDFYVDMVTAFDRTTDGGPATMVIDIGKSGATKRYGAGIDLQATTDRLGSQTLTWAQILDGGTTQFVPPHVEADGVAPVLTITTTTANISTNNAGEARIYARIGQLPNR